MLIGIMKGFYKAWFFLQFMDILFVGLFSHFRGKWKKLELRLHSKCQGGQLHPYGIGTRECLFKKASKEKEILLVM